MRFPLTCAPDDPAREFVEIVNAAFYSGCLLALCKSKEEYGPDRAYVLRKGKGGQAAGGFPAVTDRQKPEGAAAPSRKDMIHDTVRQPSRRAAGDGPVLLLAV